MCTNLAICEYKLETKLILRRATLKFTAIISNPIILAFSCTTIKFAAYEDPYELLLSET
jgi:hypothetical protein